MSTSRMPAILARQLTEAQQQAIAEVEASRGFALMGPFIPLQRSPDLLRRVSALGQYCRVDSALPPRLSELIILLVAREWTQQFEWSVHCPIALAAGVPKAVAVAVAEGRRPAVMAGDEEAVYDLCTELLRTRQVSDATYANALESLGERGVIDAVGIAGYYSLIAMVLNTARVSPEQLPDGVPELVK